VKLIKEGVKAGRLEYVFRSYIWDDMLSLETGDTLESNVLGFDG